MRFISYFGGLLLFALLTATTSCAIDQTTSCTSADVAISSEECRSVAVCSGSMRDCVNGASDGCETDVSGDVNNCGGCGIKCPQALNAGAVCVAGQCGLSGCASGYLDCNGRGSDGCEIDGFRDLNNCGGCGTVCGSGPNGKGTCQAGKCVLACSPGYLDCNGDVSDGCETNGTADLNNCGNCGNVCPPSTSLKPACAGGTCITSACIAPQLTCKPGPIDGCEANSSSDISNCGACNKKCTVANGTPACKTSNCAIGSCNTNFADCNTTYADGCESNLTSDPKNCSACGKACTYANAAGTCTASVCAMGACNPNFADCNKMAGDGCEINTSTDGNNCGACGKVCAANQVCSAGVCSSNCRIVAGIRWCYNPASCGQACTAVCASLGLPFTITDAAWFAAQDTVAECQAISDAFGVVGAINFGGFTYACMEDNGGSHTVPTVPLGGLFCSSDSGCPSQHRGNMDQIGVACGGGSRLSICPCQ